MHNINHNKQLMCLILYKTNSFTIFDNYMFRTELQFRIIDGKLETNGDKL
jgi:hypothetical protein